MFSLFPVFSSDAAYFKTKCTSRSRLKFQPLLLSSAASLLVAGGITVSIIAFVFTIKFLCELAARVVSFLQNEDPGRRGDRSIYDYVRGNYLDPRSCKVSWDWKEPQEVGQTMSFRVQVIMDSTCVQAENVATVVVQGIYAHSCNMNNSSAKLRPVNLLSKLFLLNQALFSSSVFSAVL